MSAKDAILAREAGRKPAPKAPAKAAEKPKRHAHLQVEDVPVEVLPELGEYEQELEKPDHVAGEYVEEVAFDPPEATDDD